jgi:hypothetical protein
MIEPSTRPDVTVTATTEGLTGFLARPTSAHIGQLDVQIIGVSKAAISRLHGLLRAFPNLTNQRTTT